MSITRTGCRHDGEAQSYRSEMTVLQSYRHLRWPLNLWSTVMNKQISDKELPADWEEVLVNILETLGSQKKKDILVSFCRDGLTCQEIANIYGNTISAVGQQLREAVRLLQLPCRQVYFTCGLAAKGGVLDKNSKGIVESLGLNGRTCYALIKADIKTIDKLTKLSEKELLCVTGLGVNALQEIKERLSERGLSISPPETFAAGCDNKVDLLNLSGRVYNALRRGNIQMIEQLTQYTEAALYTVRGMGREAVEEVKDRLCYLGLSLQIEKESANHEGT